MAATLRFNTPPLRSGKRYDPPRLPSLESLWEDPIGSDPIPDDAACRAICQQYAMFPHILRHCEQVANMAVALATRAEELGLAGSGLVELTHAAGLLHDIAKSYTVRHGGSHAQIGASWVISACGNRRIAQAVFHHVEWPWALPDSLIHPVFFVLYADKRARHDELVSLDERYEDLMVRYGKNEHAIAAMQRGWKHAQSIERRLSAQLEFSLHESTAVGGRLVHGA